MTSTYLNTMEPPSREYIVGIFADHGELEAVQKVMETKINVGKVDKVHFRPRQATPAGQPAFLYQYLDNAPIGKRYQDIRVYLVLSQQQGGLAMEGMVSTILPYLNRLHNRPPLTVFSSGFCAGRNKDSSADTLGNVCLAVGALQHRGGGRQTSDGLLANVRTAEPEGLQMWNALAHTPNLWSDPEQIPGIERPKRKNERGELTDDWRPQLELGYFSTDEVVRTFPEAFDQVLAYSRKVIALDMEAYHFYNACHRTLNVKFPFILAKTVTDYAGARQGEGFKPYGVRLAALYLLELIGVYLDTLDPATLNNGDSDGSSLRKDEKYRECLGNLRATDARDDKKRIEKLNGNLLQKSYQWILENNDFRQWQEWHDQPENQLLWIKGDPGKGKTMLLCGIIDELRQSMGKLTANTGLLTFFFCQAADSRINSASAVLRSVIYQLLDQQPGLTYHVRNKYDHAGKVLFEDANAWVVLSDILSNILRDPNLPNTFLIIDALDECLIGLRQLLDFIAENSSASRHVKWIVSSRHWPHIQEGLETVRWKTTICLELNAECISNAVSLYIEDKVRELAKLKRYDSKTEIAVRTYLSSNANDTFLWVASVCQQLKKTSSWNTITTLNTLPPGLDPLYDRMFQQVYDSDEVQVCKHVLSIMTIAYRPITLDELTSFIKLPGIASDGLALWKQIVELCGSFLTIRDGTVYFVHQSAKDFLLIKASSRLFPHGVEVVHHAIFLESLRTMPKALRRDIYNLSDPGFPIGEVKTPEPDPLAAIRYSCVYWVDHLCDASRSLTLNVDLEEDGAVHRFLRERCVYWLEALSLLKSTSQGVFAMTRLEDLLQETYKSRSMDTDRDARQFVPYFKRLRLMTKIKRSLQREMRERRQIPESQVIKLVRDTRRFILYFKGAIEYRPLQVYASGLVFSPARSSIKELFKTEEPRWLTNKPPMQDNWDACLQTLEGHDGSIISVAFSHDSQYLASSDDKTIKVWDATSGRLLRALRGHSDSVRSVAFSHDSQYLASASDDKTIKVWDATSGRLLRTLQGHRGSVRSVAFSHDSQYLASASWDASIKIWDTGSGQWLQTLQGFDDSSLRTYWPSRRIQMLQTLQGHRGLVTSVAFSHDSKSLASASYDETIKIWDATSGRLLRTLQGHSGSVRSIAFSHDSQYLASASDDKTIKIWDTASGRLLRALQGHSDSVISVAFSHDSQYLASASDDKTIQVWDATSGRPLRTLQGHSGSVRSIAFSHDSQYLASASDDKTVKIWDAASGRRGQMDRNLRKFLMYWADRRIQMSQTLQGHHGLVSSVAFSHDSKSLASASYDKTIKIWDATSGRLLRTLRGHSDSVRSVAFSQDSQYLASASWDASIKIWDTGSGRILQTLQGHSDLVTSVAFSHDSKSLASASSYDETIKIWDATSGRLLRTLQGHSGSVRSIAFSQDSQYLASASWDASIKIWDTGSGQWLQTLKGHDGSLSSVITYNECSQTLVIDMKCLSNISVGNSESHFNTEYGDVVFHIPFSAEDFRLTGEAYQKSSREGYGISSDGTWIFRNAKDILWIPPEHRPYIWTIRTSSVCIGSVSGHILVLKFVD